MIIQVNKPILSKLLGCCLLPHSHFILIFGGKDINVCQRECYLYNYKTNQVTSTNPISSDFNEVINMPAILNNKVCCYFWKSNSERELLRYDYKSRVWVLTEKP